MRRHRATASPASMRARATGEVTDHPPGAPRRFAEHAVHGQSTDEKIVVADLDAGLVEIAVPVTVERHRQQGPPLGEEDVIGTER